MVEVGGTGNAVSVPMGRVVGVVTSGIIVGEAKERSPPSVQSVAGAGIVCTGAVNPVEPPIQVEAGSRVARTNGT